MTRWTKRAAIAMALAVPGLALADAAQADPLEIVDISLTETLRRTFMTAGTVVVVLVALLWLGGPALQWFSVALLIGTFAGTYSSIYIATNYALMMGLDKEDFIEKPKAELVEEETFD